MFGASMDSNRYADEEDHLEGTVQCEGSRNWGYRVAGSKNEWSCARLNVLARARGCSCSSRVGDP